jgi:hypothetical protein
LSLFLQHDNSPSLYLYYMGFFFFLIYLLFFFMYSFFTRSNFYSIFSCIS